MLEKILDYIHNYFVKEIHRGKFKIESNALTVDFLQSGQYYKIVGSVFNDGVHKYDNNETLVDEEFNGEIRAMAVPLAVINLAQEVADWESENDPQSPFISESFGGYSYTKGKSSDTGGPLGWRDVFKDELNHWRKLA